MSEDHQRWRELYGRLKPHTMVWEAAFYDNLSLCRTYHQRGMSVVECGVWKGGMIAAMAAELSDPEAAYHLFDSFEGLPPAEEVDGEAALNWQADKDSPIYYDNCRANIEEARLAMEKAGVSRYEIHPGWFEDTLADWRPDKPISILRLDADWYASTKLCLEKLFPHVAAGGLVILDDYRTWEGCAKAVDEYLKDQGISAQIVDTQFDVSYFIKPKHTPLCGEL
jgi:O-methyltransferase